MNNKKPLEQLAECQELILTGLRTGFSSSMMIKMVGFGYPSNIVSLAKHQAEVEFKKEEVESKKLNTRSPISEHTLMIPDDIAEGLKLCFPQKEPRKVQEGDWVLVFGGGEFQRVILWKDSSVMNSVCRYFIPPLGRWNSGNESDFKTHINVPLAFSTLEEAEKHCVEVKG